MIVAEFAFPPEPLESQHNLPVLPHFPSTKLEMILIFKGMFSRHGAKQAKDTLAKTRQKTIMPDDQIEFFRTILSRYLGDLCALA